MSQDTNFAEQERARLEAELADLRKRRDQLRADMAADADTVGDRGDAAGALQRRGPRRRGGTDQPDRFLLAAATAPSTASCPTEPR